MEYVVTGYGKRYLKTDVTFDNLCSMARCQDGGGGGDGGNEINEVTFGNLK